MTTHTIPNSSTKDRSLANRWRGIPAIKNEILRYESKQPDSACWKMIELEPGESELSGYSRVPLPYHMLYSISDCLDQRTDWSEGDPNRSDIITLMGQSDVDITHFRRLRASTASGLCGKRLRISRQAAPSYENF